MIGKSTVRPADPADTIVALASAPGDGARAIVRLSGPTAWKVVRSFFVDLPAEPGFQRLLLSGSLCLPDVASPLPADVYFWPRPRSYTGQDMVELHVVSSPPLIELIVHGCLKAGVRAAQPGEFTLRAFLAGKRDLPRAEAVLGVIHARSRDELKSSLAQLAGGLTAPLAQMREDLLNLLADVEAGLDFSDEDLSFVGTAELLKRLARALAMVTLVHKQIEQRSLSAKPFRAVLAGPPNAGKSSLFNALLGRGAALVSDVPGTTRDYLCARLTLDDVVGDPFDRRAEPRERSESTPSDPLRGSARQVIELIDTAGLDEKLGTMHIEQAAQRLGMDQARDADLIVWCQEADGQRPACPFPQEMVLNVATKADLAAQISAAEPLATSAVTGLGLDRLKSELAERVRRQAHAGLAPSLSRCRHHVDACLERLRAAHACVLRQEPAEFLAMELRIALDEMGAMVGAIYTDDLLDRIFSRFCIGK